MNAVPHVPTIRVTLINPLTLRVPLESIVCYVHTFANNSGIKQKFPEYLKGSCSLTSG